MTAPRLAPLTPYEIAQLKERIRLSDLDDDNEGIVMTIREQKALIAEIEAARGVRVEEPPPPDDFAGAPPLIAEARQRAGELSELTGASKAFGHVAELLRRLATALEAQGVSPAAGLDLTPTAAAKKAAWDQITLMAHSGRGLSPFEDEWITTILRAANVAQFGVARQASPHEEKP